MLFFPIPDFFSSTVYRFLVKILQTTIISIIVPTVTLNTVEPPLKATSRQRSFFPLTDSPCILIVLHLYPCSKRKLSTACLLSLYRMLRTLLVLPRQRDSKHYSSFLCILSLYIFYDWIAIMGYGKHELSTINMLYSLKKIVVTSPSASYFCPRGGRCVERFDCIFISGVYSEIIDLLVKFPFQHT